MFAIIKKCLLHYYVNGSNYTKCMSLGNQKCMIQPTLTNLHPNGVENFTTIHLRLN